MIFSVMSEIIIEIQDVEKKIGNNCKIIIQEIKTTSLGNVHCSGVCSVKIGEFTGNFATRISAYMADDDDRPNKLIVGIDGLVEFTRNVDWEKLQ